MKLEHNIDRDTGPGLVRIRLWDLPVRLFHWSLAVAVPVALVTGLIGGDLMAIHGKAGLVILGLVVFRVVWGFVGSTHVRFVNFAPSLTRIRAHLAGRWQGVGHNPLGALAVFALLGLLAVQTGTGLFADDDISFRGPLSVLVDEAFSHRLTAVHAVLSNILMGLVLLHLAAIVFHLFHKKENLVKPMVTGWKPGRVDDSGVRGGPLALTIAVTVALAVVYMVANPRVSAPAAPAVKSAPAW